MGDSGKLTCRTILPPPALPVILAKQQPPITRY
jgi:hypothetical protein